MAATDSYDDEPQPAAAEPAPTADPDDELVQRLKELSELHDQGVLTDTQFEEAKNRLID